MQRAGLVDDRRFASDRAEQLADRGCGDLMIEDDLERQGVPAHICGARSTRLEPESARVAMIVGARGTSPQTFRYLAGKGFSEGALESLVADLAADALG